MVQESSVKNYLFYIGVIMVCGIYLSLRLSFPETIEFGYDQPILASTVLDFIKNPTFLNSYNYVLYNPWGYPSWGPMQIFIYVPALLLTRNPIHISYLIIIFNLLGVLILMFVGKKFFSNRVALISGIILATHPWWIVFSRMIYQPSVTPTFISLLIFLTFYVLNNPKTKIIGWLLLCWTVSYQLYVHTISFITISFLSVIFIIKKISKKYVILGIVGSLILFVPQLVFYKNNPVNFFDYKKISYKFEELRKETPYSSKEVAKEFISTLAGGGFKWHLGYGYDDFVNKFTPLPVSEKIGFFTVVLMVIYNLICVIFKSNHRVERLLLLSWMMGPLFFLMIIKTPIALPRYFILSLPAFSILFALTLSELFGRFSYLALVFISVSWITLIFNYYIFVKNYKYGSGFLSNYSDVPFSFLDKSFKWVLNDAQINGYSEITVSDNPEKPYEFSLNRAQTYFWENLLNNDLNLEGRGKTGHYLMYFSPATTKYDYMELGPYVVSKIGISN